MSSQAHILIDGEPADSISVLDRGLLLADGCFEVLRTWGGVAVDLDRHLERLYDTASFLRMRTRARAQVATDVARAIAGARAHGAAMDHRIRIVLTRGSGGLAEPMDSLGPGRTIVIVEPLPAPPSEISLALVDWPLPSRTGRGHKTLAYTDHVIALELARSAGADEAVRLDADGAVAEGATCNVFVIDEAGVLATPATDRGVLPGVVRGRVIGWCEREGLPMRIRPVAVDELQVAREIFVTSSLRGVVAVTRLDGRALPAGPITSRIAAGYAADMRSG